LVYLAERPAPERVGTGDSYVLSNPNGEQVNPTYSGAEVKRQPRNLYCELFSSDPVAALEVMR
jgi:hypothetical protein